MIPPHLLLFPLHADATVLLFRLLFRLVEVAVLVRIPKFIPIVIILVTRLKPTIENMDSLLICRLLILCIIDKPSKMLTRVMI